jgi:hypothetical protein
MRSELEAIKPRNIATRTLTSHADHPVNFVSHAAVASWYDTSPLFVLGAMLPDFLGMLGMRAVPVSEELVRGVAFHHASDAAFHEAPQFIKLTHEARRALTAAGCSKGPARAVAHIGVELLLDPVLLDESGARDAYTKAIERAAAVRDEIAFLPGDAARFFDFCRLLSQRDLPRRDDLESVVVRIRRALAGRPRLALDEAGVVAVRNWVVAAQPSVVGCTSDVIRHMLSKLDDQGFGRATRAERHQ